MPALTCSETRAASNSPIATTAVVNSGGGKPRLIQRPNPAGTISGNTKHQINGVMYACGGLPRARAIARFATLLSQCPPAAAAADVKALGEAGLTDAEILDLILAVAMFGWANRLVQALGEPVTQPR